MGLFTVVLLDVAQEGVVLSVFLESLDVHPCGDWLSLHCFLFGQLEADELADFGTHPTGAY